jgi:hypothetical protein
MRRGLRSLSPHNSFLFRGSPTHTALSYTPVACLPRAVSQPQPPRLRRAHTHRHTHTHTDRHTPTPEGAKASEPLLQGLHVGDDRGLVPADQLRRGLG